MARKTRKNSKPSNKKNKTCNKVCNQKNSTECKVVKKPELEDILKEADMAFTGIIQKYLILGTSLVKAEEYYGAVGKKAFRVRFPLTENALRHLELVGRGKLLPQFTMCSDRFVSGLVNMAESLTWQYRLLGASKNGMIRIRTNDGVIKDARFTDLSKCEIDGVLSIISEENKGISVQELAEKLSRQVAEVRSNFQKNEKPIYEIGTEGDHKYVRFFKSKKYTAGDLRKIIEKLEG